MIDVGNSDAVLMGPQGEVLVRKTPGVCGGDACVGDSRIMVWLLVALKNEGLSEDKLLKSYPTLTSSHLAAAWEYYRLHPEEIAEAIREQEEDVS